LIKIAFAGNPNVGKTALINKIAGSDLKVGNWPGVTVEKKEAELIYKNEKIQLIDLPGVYSLSPYSMEEIITRDYILEEKPDVVINVVDSTNLERNLYLTLLLQELGKPMVVALNLFDEFEKLDFKLNHEKFDNFLGVKSVKTSATTGMGVDELLDEAIKIGKDKKDIKYSYKFSDPVEKELNNIISKLNKDNALNKLKEIYSLKYIAIKLLEKDTHFISKAKERYNLELEEYAKTSFEAIETKYEEEADIVLSENRYATIKGIVVDTVTTALKNRLDFSDKIDKVLLNSFFGMIMFFLIMLTVFSITFNGSDPFINWVDAFMSDYVGKYVGILVEGTPEWLNSLVVDGIIGGVGGVVVFVPLMLFLYFFLSILEESGYMARVAFLMDKIMRKVGLNGKAFVPLILGFGCTVPGVFATKTLENEKARRLTAVMLPFMSCGARLPVYALFVAAFFRKNGGLIVFSLYMLGIVVAILIGLIFKRFDYFKSEEKALLIELPPYRIPSFKMIWRSAYRRTLEYLKKATTVILAVLIVLWALTYFPNSGDTQSSYLATVSKAIKPVFAPVGFADRWEMVAAIPPSIAAKEVVVGFLGQVLTIEESEEDEEETTFWGDTYDQVRDFAIAAKDSVIGMVSFNISNQFVTPDEEELEEEVKGIITATSKIWENDSKGPLKAYSFMAFILLVVPCVVTLAAVKQEMGQKMMWIIVAVMTIVPYIVSVIIYQLGSLVQTLLM